MYLYGATILAMATTGKETRLAARARAGRSHELAISSSKQYALMATCWPLPASLDSPTPRSLARPSLVRGLV